MSAVVEATLTRLVASVIGIDPIERDAGLIELGMDSLRVIVLLNEVEREFGKRIVVEEFLKSPTIGRLAELLQTAFVPGLPDEIDVIRRGDAPEGLFFVHGIGGWVPHRPYLAHLPSEMPAYGLRLVPGMKEEPLEAAAARHARAMQAVQPRGPYHLIGFSYGAHLAYEIARQLAAAQQPVGLLALIDATLGFNRTMPHNAIDHHAIGRVPSRILYVRSSWDFESSYLMPGGGWEELALGGVDSVRVTGGHVGTVAEPTAVPIGQILRQALGGREADPSPHILHREFIEHTGAESSWRIEARELARAGDLPGQLEVYRIALSKEPLQPAWVIVNFARLCHALGRTELLEPVVASLTLRCARDARLAYALGIVHNIRGDHDLAAEAFRQSADLECYDPAPFVQLVHTAETEAELDEAMRTALARSPADPGLWVHLAEALRAHRRFGAAVALLREATAMAGGDDWVLEQLRVAEEPWRQQQEYERFVKDVCRLVSASTPDGASVLVISKGDPGLLDVDGRRARHFPCDTTGRHRSYHPADSREAVDHLEDLRNDDAQFLVVPAPSLWWLDHYAGFQEHLHARYRLLVDDPSCRIFDMRDA